MNKSQKSDKSPSNALQKSDKSPSNASKKDKDKPDVEAGDKKETQSSIKDTKKATRKSELKKVIVKKEPMKVCSSINSSEGKIVLSWNRVSGSWGLDKYPYWDYEINKFKDEHLLGILGKEDVS